MEVATIVGSVAALCSMTSFAPQAWKIIQSGETKDISAAMYALTVTGFALWFTYGVLLGDWPLMVTNGVSGLMAAFILAMKLLPDRVVRSLRPK
jgi:MtN3 and saliva related transmembrane protein